MNSASRTFGRLILPIAIFVGIGVLAAANAHLVYVAFQSQPECVSHLKPGHADEGYRAARSSC